MDSLDALNLAAPIADTYNELEAMLLNHIAEQLAANPDTLINATSEWRIKLLAQMGRVNKETAKIIAAKTGKVPAEVEKVVEQAINKVLVENAVSGKSVSVHIENAMKSFDRQAVITKYNQVNTVMQYKAKQAFVNGVNGVADRFERKQQAEIANKQEYLNVLNKNALAVTVGEKSRTEALRETIGQMCDKGIPAFVDASGRQWSPEAYVNMDIRNTAKNSALAAQWSVMDELEQDVILISSHSGARPKCAPYQGKLYSRSGKSGTIKDARGREYTYEPLSSTSFGEPDGIFGINCGHRPRGVSEGTFISHEEIYSEKENSEEYEKICEQRRQERKIRADKNKRDALKAAGDNEGAKELGRKITAENKELKAYCEREGLSYREDRTKGYGYANTNDKRSLVEKSNKKPITIITEETISNVPKVSASSYSDNICDLIHHEHQNLLHESMKNNDNKEVAFIFNNDFSDKQIEYGSDDKIEFGSLYGKDLFVMHNHPRNNSFSIDDVVEFIGEGSIKSLSVIKNNGNVEILTKLSDYDRITLMRELDRMVRKQVKTGSDAEYRAVVNKFLNKYSDMGVIEWLK